MYDNGTGEISFDVHDVVIKVKILSFYSFEPLIDYFPYPLVLKEMKKIKVN